jgi:hypothetical protein
MTKVNYDKLRPDILEQLVANRGIECKNNRTDMIRHLKLDDEGKYTKETSYEKQNNGFVVGIDIRNTKHLTEIGKLIEKKDAKSLNRYSNDVVYYWSKQKLL